MIEYREGNGDSGTTCRYYIDAKLEDLWPWLERLAEAFERDPEVDDVVLDGDGAGAMLSGYYKPDLADYDEDDLRELLVAAVKHRYDAPVDEALADLSEEEREELILDEIRQSQEFCDFVYTWTEVPDGYVESGKPVYSLEEYTETLSV